MRVIVRDMDDDEAVLIMADSNLQREEILPGEKAFSYKMKPEAMKRRAGSAKIMLRSLLERKLILGGHKITKDA